MIKENTIKLNGEIVPYKFRKNRLSKNIRISVRSDATVLVSAPLWLSRKKAEGFLIEKADWVLERISDFKKNKLSTGIKNTEIDYKKKKERVRKMVVKKLEDFNKHYKLKYNRVSIRNQRTRWGSCSGKANLNFNYRLAYLGDKEVDYIVVHELCHLKEMNHSSRFWLLVAETIPDYKNLRKSIKKKGLELF